MCIRDRGEAAKPQTLPYKQNMTLLDVMIVVGGLTDFSDGNATTLLRSSEGNKQYRAVSYTHLDVYKRQVSCRVKEWR